MAKDESGLVPADHTDGTEKALSALAALVSAAPWVGGPVSNVLNGIGLKRKMKRVKTALDQMGKRLEDFRSEASEQ